MDGALTAVATTLVKKAARPRGTGSVQSKPNRGGLTYYAVVRVAGKPKWLKAGPTRDDAEALLHQVFAGVVDPCTWGRPSPAALAVEPVAAADEVWTFEEYAEAWLVRLEERPRKPGTKDGCPTSSRTFSCRASAPSCSTKSSPPTRGEPAAVPRQGTRGALRRRHRTRANPEGWMFSGVCRRDGRVLPLDPGHWRKTVFYPTARAAGLPEYTVPHSLRHSAAVASLRGRPDPEHPERSIPPASRAKVQAAPRPASAVSTEWYTKLTPADFGDRYDVWE